MKLTELERQVAENRERRSDQSSVLYGIFPDITLRGDAAELANDCIEFVRYYMDGDVTGAEIRKRIIDLAARIEKASADA